MSSVPPLSTEESNDEPESRPMVGHVKIIFTGPVAPHWEYHSDFGDAQFIEDFKLRAQARLLLLPRDDPQFRRNCERIIRDAERNCLILDWDLGYSPEELQEHQDQTRQYQDQTRR